MWNGSGESGESGESGGGGGAPLDRGGTSGGGWPEEGNDSRGWLPDR